MMSLVIVCVCVCAHARLSTGHKSSALLNAVNTLKRHSTTCTTGGRSVKAMTEFLERQKHKLLQETEE